MSDVTVIPSSSPLAIPSARRGGIARRSKAAARRLINTAIERYLRIDTTPLASAPARGSAAHDDSIPYEPLDYPFLLRTLSRLAPREDDVVYEIGCGMGRVLCLLARRRFRRCVGIELCGELADRARANVSTVRGLRTPVEVLTADAALADYADGTAFFMFHPFGPRTMEATIARIHASVLLRPRPIRIMYVNPFHENVLEASGWLRCTDRLKSRCFNTFASYWVSHGQSDARGTHAS
ncbi:MAG: class I SAM-dependent methyltransferase [Tepidisphaeraceae bacterium]